MDPVGYKTHNRIPNIFAKSFIEEVSQTTGWKYEDFELGMDVGCGPGKISTFWVHHYFPKIKKIIGTDMDPAMIALAIEQNDKPRIEFHVANIMEKSSMMRWEGRVDRLFSNFMLHRVTDQKQAFKNICDLLVPSGEAALSVILEGPYYFAFRDLLQIPKWKPILEPLNVIFPEAMRTGYKTLDYDRMFQSLGFVVKHCETKVLGVTYESDEECKNLLYSLQTIGNLPDGYVEEFKKDLFDRYLLYCGRNKDGFPVHKLTVLHAVLVKIDYSLIRD